MDNNTKSTEDQLLDQIIAEEVKVKKYEEMIAKFQAEEAESETNNG